MEVGTQLSGQLAKIHVDFNDEVKAGQPLAELDQRSFSAKVVEARAAIVAAQTLVKVQETRVERARVDVRDARTRSAVLQARIESAQARNNAAEKALKRAEALRTQGVSASDSIRAGGDGKRDAAAEPT